MAERPDEVCILLATYQGAAFLPEQLASFAAQTHDAWQLVVADDGSSDGTQQILDRFAAEQAAEGRKVSRRYGPGRGATANFLTLLSGAPDVAWIALSDQDDVWFEDRLARGITALADLPTEVPALYCSATEVTDTALQHPQPSPDVPKPPGFKNALLQNIAAGNTILLNRAAAQLARRLAPRAAEIPGLAVHDWWLYLIVTGAGGQVIYDPAPTLFYRQHQGNQIGVNRGLGAALFRLSLLFRGRFRDWTDANLTALAQAEGHLTDENRALVAAFADLRRAPLIERLQGMRRLGLYRQSRAAQITLWLALVLGKL